MPSRPAAAEDRDLPVDEHFDDQHVRGGQRGCLRCGDEPAVDAADDDQREGCLPCRLFQRTPDLANPERDAGYLRGDSHANAVSGKDHDKQYPGNQSRDKKPVDADPGDNAIEDDRQRWREKQAEASRRRHQPQRESLRVALLEQGRQEEAAQGDDRHSRCTAESGEDRRREDRHDGEAARHPPEERLGEVHQPLRALAFCEHVPGECEERDGDEGRKIDQPVQLGDQRRGIDTGRGEGEQPDGGNDRKQRRAGKGDQYQHAGRNPRFHPGHSW